MNVKNRILDILFCNLWISVGYVNVAPWDNQIGYPQDEPAGRVKKRENAILPQLPPLSCHLTLFPLFPLTDVELNFNSILNIFTLQPRLDSNHLRIGSPTR